MLDPSIPLQSRLPQAPLGMGDMLALKQQMRQRQMLAREQKRSETLKSMFQRNLELGPEGPKLNEQGFVRGLAQSGMPEEAYQYSQKFNEQKQKQLEDSANKARMVSKRKKELVQEQLPYLESYTDIEERKRTIRDQFKSEGIPYTETELDAISTDDGLKRFTASSSSNSTGHFYVDDQGNPMLGSLDINNPFSIPLTTKEGKAAPKVATQFKSQEILLPDGRKVIGGMDPRTNTIQITGFVDGAPTVPTPGTTPPPLAGPDAAPITNRKGVTPGAAGDEAEKLRIEQEKLRLAAEKAAIEAEKASRDAKATQSQFAAAGYAQRLKNTISEMNALESKGFDRSTLGSGAESSAPNALQSSNMQQQSRAERDFVNAVLRRESGAAISPAEFQSAEKQYFPRAGDSKETLANKKRARDQAFANLRAEAGTAWDEIEKVKTVNSPPGTVKVGRGGVKYRKKAAGPDSDKSLWEKVK